MKTPSTELYELIQAMDAREKRYFKKFTGIYSKEKNNKYLRIFDILKKQKKYDEQALKMQLKDQKLVRNLPSAKKYLYELILKSLRVLQENINERDTIAIYEKNAKILSGKGLINQFEKQINKAIKSAEDFGEHLYLYDLKDVKFSLFENKNIFKEASILNNELEHTAGKVKRNISLHERYRSTFHKVSKEYIKLGGKVNSAFLDLLNEISKHEIFKDVNLAPDFPSLLRFHQFWMIYHYTKKDFKSCYASNQSIIKHIEQKKNMLKHNVYNYVFYFCNSFLLMNKTKEYQDLKDLSVKIILFLNDYKKKLNNETRSSVIVAITTAELSYYIDTAQFKKAEGKIKIIFEELIKYQGNFTKNQLFTIYFFMAEIYFYTHQLDKSWEMLKLILSENTKEREDINQAAEIFMGIILFEKNEVLMLENHLRNLYNKLYKKDKLDNPSKLVISQLKKLSNFKNRSDIKGFFKDFESALSNNIKEPENWVFQFLPIKNWVKSKLEDRSLIEISKRSAIQDPFSGTYQSMLYDNKLKQVENLL